MPSRWMSMGIVLFWLATTGWLFWHELLPRLVPGQPPPYTIDPTEEAQVRRPFIDWTVEHNGKKAFRARTQIEHPSHDVYELSADFTPLTGSPPIPVNGSIIRRMNSLYRVNTAGDLLAVSARVSGAPVLGALLDFRATEYTLHIEGTVEHPTLTLRSTLDLPGPIRRDRSPEEVPVARGGSFLLPLHPVNRLRGLSKGQTWTIHALDPVPSPLESPGEGVRFLRARVRNQEEEVRLGRRVGEPCLVIDYTGDDLQASTWVSGKTGLVLFQDVTSGKDHWTLYRE